MQCEAELQTVPSAAPFTKITDAPPPWPATNPSPFTAKVKSAATPAITLEGKICSIAGPEVIETVAVANCDKSAKLVAITEIAFGEGAASGAVYTPFASIVPQAVPLHPVPDTPPARDQITLVLLVPVTAAVNCNWLGADDPDGGIKALAGEIVTFVDPPPVPTILICALALLVESASLVAVSATGFAEGTVAGAKKSIVVVPAPAGGTHGFEFVTQTCPSTVFPFATPLTVQTTDVSLALLTSAAKLARCCTTIFPLPGATLIVTLLTIVTVAEDEIPAATASIVTILGEGRSVGAV